MKVDLKEKYKELWAAKQRTDAAATGAKSIRE